MPCGQCGWQQPEEERTIPEWPYGDWLKGQTLQKMKPDISMERNDLEKREDAADSEIHNGLNPVSSSVTTAGVHGITVDEEATLDSFRTLQREDPDLKWAIETGAGADRTETSRHLGQESSLATALEPMGHTVHGRWYLGEKKREQPWGNN